MSIDELVHATIFAGSGLRFDDLVRLVRLCESDADVCVIDFAARPFERGEPGAYTYEATACPCEGEEDDPGPAYVGSAWSEPEHGGVPLAEKMQLGLPWVG